MSEFTKAGDVYSATDCSVGSKETGNEDWHKFLQYARQLVLKSEKAPLFRFRVLYWTQTEKQKKTGEAWELGC